MKKQIAVFVITAVFSGCTRKYYLPPVINTPLFKEKNELFCTLSSGSSGETSTNDFSCAYSITKNLAIQTNFMKANGGNPGSGETGKGKYMDAAFGYFAEWEKNVVLEAFGGIGYGSQQHHYSFYFPSFLGAAPVYLNGTSRLNFSRLLVQVAIGYSSKAFDIVFSNGATALIFNNIQNNINSGSSEYLLLDSMARKKTFFNIEPALTLRAGWKYVKLQVQFSVFRNLDGFNNRLGGSKINIGLSFAYAQRFRNKTAKTAP